MKSNAILILLIFSISVFAGCIEGGSSATDKEKILELELEITNLTTENEELGQNNLIIQETLDSARLELNNSNENIFS